MKALQSIIGIVCLGLVSCQSNTNEKNTANTSKETGVEKVFEGQVPCADCAGIDLRVSLKNDNDSAGSFRLTQTFKGTRDGDQTFSDSGSFSMRKGLDADAEAWVYVIRPGQPEETRYFEKRGDTALLSLGNDGQRIQSELNYLLKRK